LNARSASPMRVPPPQSRTRRATAASALPLPLRATSRVTLVKLVENMKLSTSRDVLVMP